MLKLRSFILNTSISSVQALGEILLLNGLMAFPNLIGLLGLSKVVVDETKKYLELEISAR